MPSRSARARAISSPPEPIVRETVMTGLRTCRARDGGSSSALTMAWMTACALTAMTLCSPLFLLHNTPSGDVEASVGVHAARRESSKDVAAQAPLRYRYGPVGARSRTRRRDGRAAQGARLESVFTERCRGFESHSLRQRH